MEESEIAKLLGISQSDQATSEWATFATNIATATLAYRRQLVVEISSGEEILALTQNFQTGYLGLLASITAMKNALGGKQS